MSNDNSSQAQRHARVNDILLGPIERPLLAWFVRHMPRWVTPDTLTFTGLFAAFLIMAAYMLCSYSRWYLWLASFGFLLNWFGDSLDGSLARFRKIERPRYGFFIDHSVDTISIIAVFIGLGVSPYVTLEYALFALIGYLSMEVMVLSATFTQGIFQISYGKLGPTEARALAVLVNTVLFFVVEPRLTLPFGVFGLYDFVLLIVTLLMFVFFISGVFRTGRALAALEKR